MSDDIQSVHDWAKSKLERIEQRKILNEAFLANLKKIRTETIPAILAGPVARAHENTLSLEKELPRKLEELEKEHQMRLAQAKRRTQLLQDWLQELS